MKLSFNIKPDERLEDFAFELRATGDRATELKPVMVEIVNTLLTRNRRAFETRGATTGMYWAPLKASTVKRKARLSYVADPFAPLRERDALMKSLSERGAPHQTLDEDDDGFVLATTLNYAGIHAAGSPDTNLPVRPPMTIPKKHAHEYIGMINDFIFEGEDA